MSGLLIKRQCHVVWWILTEGPGFVAGSYAGCLPHLSTGGPERVEIQLPKIARLQKGICAVDKQVQLPRHSDEDNSDTLNRLEVDHVVGPLRGRVRGHESQLEVRMLGCAKEQRGHHAPSRVRM